MSEVGWYIQIGEQWCWSTASIVAGTFEWNTGIIFCFVPTAVAPSCGTS